MIKNLKQYEVSKGVKLSVIKDNRFKTGKISINMYLPLNVDSASANAILPFILSKSCNKYKDFSSLNKKLNGLYGASIGADISKVGDVEAITISAAFLDSRYTLYNEDTFSEITKLLCNMLFEPNLVDGKFPLHIIEQEKRQLVELIESEMNDKKTLARNRCIELMCHGEKFSINKYGTKNQVLNLKSDDIYKVWQNILKTAKIEIMIVGESDGLSALEVFKKEFSKIEREKIVECSSDIISLAEKVKEKTDIIEVAQSKLVIGFRTGGEKSIQDTMATRLMTALYGVSPQSKLFLNVREKLSLCYYCSALYDRYKEIILVQSGVESQNIERAKEEILNQLNEIKEGNFTDDNLKAIKLNLINNYQTVGDYIGNLENFYIAQNLDNSLLSPEDFISMLNQVTREQVIKAANMVTLDTIYVLTGKEEAQI